MLIDMSWRGLRRRLLRRGATGEGHLEADLCWSVACMDEAVYLRKAGFELQQGLLMCPEEVWNVLLERLPSERLGCHDWACIHLAVAG